MECATTNRRVMEAFSKYLQLAESDHDNLCPMEWTPDESTQSTLDFSHISHLLEKGSFQGFSRIPLCVSGDAILAEFYSKISQSELMSHAVQDLTDESRLIDLGEVQDMSLLLCVDPDSDMLANICQKRCNKISDDAQEGCRKNECRRASSLRRDLSECREERSRNCSDIQRAYEKAEQDCGDCRRKAVENKKDCLERCLETVPLHNINIFSLTSNAHSLNDSD